MQLIYSLKNVKYTNRYKQKQTKHIDANTYIFNYITVILYKILGFEISYK